MRDLIVASTLEALPCVVSPRFFVNERGYACALAGEILRRLEAKNLVADGRIVETEYHKTRLHNTKQRPDIIFHIPVEFSGAEPTANNYAVWAMKRNADADDAIDDFWKLDMMFEQLHYPLGFFVNLNSQDDKLELYNGAYADRLVGIAVWLDGGVVYFHFRNCHEIAD